MKRIIAIGIAMLFFISFHPVKADKMQFQFEFAKPMIIQKNSGYEIEIKNCKKMEVNGMVIPVKPINILLPPAKDVKGIKVYGKMVYLGRYKPEKAKGIVANGIVLKSIARYDSSTPSYKKVGVYGLRGYKILVLDLLPVVYEKGKLFYYKNMNVEIELKNGKLSDLYRGLEKDKKWAEMYVINPWVADEYPAKKVDQKYEYLIITNDELKNAFERLAEYKEQHGIKTKIATVESIVKNSSFWNERYPIFNDTQAKIRRFIRYAYKNWGIEYVLLGGDSDIMNKSSYIVPARYLYATCHGLPLGKEDKLEAYIPSDVYYACLDGTFNTDMDDKWGENASGNSATHQDEADLYAEVWVGRACVDSIQEANNLINKTIAYEESKNDKALMQVLLLGEYLGFGGEAQWGGNHKDKVVPYIPSVYNITKLYDKYEEWDKYKLASVLNKGVNIVNHDGHGWTTYALKMRNRDLKLLKNKDYFFLYSQTCLAGSFDNWYPENHYYEDDCFAEHLTTGKYGAFACVMNARYGLGRQNSTDSPGERYDLSFFKGLFEKGIREVGRANHFSKEDNVWRIDENGMRWTYYETNLFGDPQVAIKEPGEKISVNVTIEKPSKGLYIFDFGPFLNINKTIIVGGITIVANATTQPAGKIKEVEFYIDGQLKASVENPPYKWRWNEHARGTHIIGVRAVAVNGNSRMESIEAIKIF